MPGPCAGSGSLTASASYRWITGECNLVAAMFVCAEGKARNGLDWTLRTEDGIKDRTVMYTWGLGMRLRVAKLKLQELQKYSTTKYSTTEL